jgi:MFS family permease
LWSTGGIVGVAFSTLMVGLDVPMWSHLLIVSVITLIATIFCFRYLIRNDRSTSGNKLMLKNPDPYIVYLGLLVFFAAICEGGMFDWSGVYFEKVVNVKLFTLGYLTFMIFMALSRFASDYIIEHIGMQKNYVLCSIFIILGIGLAVIFPDFWPSMIGFCFVGFGTAAVIPMTFLLAGQSTKYSPGTAISLIATYSIVGMFIGPPLIGYVSHALNLRYAFVIFAFSGLMLIPISNFFFRHRQSRVEAR